MWVSMDESQIRELTTEALDALTRDDNVRALALIDQIIAAAPDDAAARALRAKALLKSGTPSDAFEEARHATRLDPGSELAHTILGIAAWQTSRLSLAQEALERAVALSGRKPSSLDDYAWFMAAERQPRPAEQAALEAIAAHAESSTAWAALGLAQFRLHRRKEAEASLGRALKLDPNDPYAQSAMVTLLSDQRQNKKAVALTRLLEEVPGTEAQVRDVRAEAKRREVAQKLVERAALPEAVYEVPVRPWVWPLLAAAMIAALWLLIRPGSLQGGLPCIFTPLILVWILRKIFG